MKMLRGVKAAVLHRSGLSVPLGAPQVGPGKLSFLLNNKQWVVINQIITGDILRAAASSSGRAAPSWCAAPLFLSCFLLYELTFLLIGCHVFTPSFCWSPSQRISFLLSAKASPSDP